MNIIGVCGNKAVLNDYINGEYDVVLKVLNRKFPCNRKALASCSPYFEAMFGQNFAEKDKEEIEIQVLWLLLFMKS